METKIFLLRGVVLFLLFIFLSLLIEYYLDNIKEEPTYYNLILLQNSLNEKADVFYFGDSVVNRTSPKDTDTLSISTMLQNETNRTVTLIWESSLGMDMFELFSHHVCSSENKPKLVIIEINLRSFSPQWPDFAFTEDKEIMTNEANRTEISVFSMLWMRFYNIFGASNNLSAESYEGVMSGYDEWYNETVYYNTTPVGKVKDFENVVYPVDQTTRGIENLTGNQYVYRYLYNLNSSNRMFSNLSKLIDNYKACNVPVLAYITPIDYENGTKSVGENFTEIVKGNVDTITNLGKTKGITIYDMSFDLLGGNFTYWQLGNKPNEHLIQEGRLYVAQRLSDIIRSNFSD